MILTKAILFLYFFNFNPFLLLFSSFFPSFFVLVLWYLSRICTFFFADMSWRNFLSSFGHFWAELFSRVGGARAPSAPPSVYAPLPPQKPPPLPTHKNDRSLTSAEVAFKSRKFKAPDENRVFHRTDFFNICFNDNSRNISLLNQFRYKFYSLARFLNQVDKLWFQRFNSCPQPWKLERQFFKK